MEQLYEWLPNGKLIEIGSGSGREIPLFVQKGYDYIGIEPSAGMIELIKTEHADTRIIQTTIYDLPFENSTFDGFWMAAILLHIPKDRIHEAFNSFKRVLKPVAYGFISIKE
jgi:SAM-dependent methyltransferase